MNILLINNNPVVSRLLALCTRDEHMVLEEVAGVETIQYERYDVVFVDEGSYDGEVVNISDIVNIGTKILLSNSNVVGNDFDQIVKKPFLPSQIIEILGGIENTNDVLDEPELNTPSIFPLSTDDTELPDRQELENSEEISKEGLSSDTQILDADELEKIKVLLDMDEEIEVQDESLSDEEIEQLKVEVIKEQLIADGLEIVGEEEIVEGFSVVDEIVVFSREETKKKKKKALKNNDNKSKKKKKKKSIAFKEEELERIEDAVQVAIATLKRKQMKKLFKGKEIEISIKLEDDV